MMKYYKVVNKTNKSDFIVVKFRERWHFEKYHTEDFDIIEISKKQYQMLDKRK